MATNRREVIEPRPGDERVVERDERGRFTEQESLDSPRRGAGRDMERDLGRENMESDDLGRTEVDSLENEELER